MRAISTFCPDNLASGRLASVAKNKAHTAIKNAELPTNQCAQSKIHRFEVPGWGLTNAITGCTIAQIIQAKPAHKNIHKIFSVTKLGTNITERMPCILTKIMNLTNRRMRVILNLIG